MSKSSGGDGVAAQGTGHPGRRGDVDESPVAAIAVEAVGGVVVRHVEVGEAVAVEVGPGDALGHAAVGDAGRRGDVDEGPVALVAKQLAGEGIVVVGFVADVEVEVAVVVVVCPRRGLGRIVDRCQAGGEGHVREGAVAVVVQQRVGDTPVAAEPAAAQDQQVGGAVVVVVGLHQVEPPVQTSEPGRLAAVAKGAVAASGEIAQAALGVGGRDDQIEHAVAVEVVDHHATHQVAFVDPGGRGDVGEARKGLAGGEDGGGDARRRRHAVRVLADGHVRDVEQPAGDEVIGVAGEQGLELGDAAPRALLVLMHAGTADRQDAALAAVAGDAVAALAPPEQGDGALELGVVDVGRLGGGAAPRDERGGLGERADGGIVVAQAQLLPAERAQITPAQGGRRGDRGGGEQPFEGARLRIAGVHVGVRGGAGDLVEDRPHALVAVARGAGRRPRSRGGGQAAHQPEGDESDCRQPAHRRLDLPLPSGGRIQTIPA